jgi:hypothetical protein
VPWLCRLFRESDERLTDLENSGSAGSSPKFYAMKLFFMNRTELEKRRNRRPNKSERRGTEMIE